MTYLIFNTLEKANTAQEKISENMRCPIIMGNYRMEKWATPEKTSDNKYAFLKPDSEYMVGVTDYTEGEPQWPSVNV